MALGDSSPFAPVDLLGGLVVNVVATNMTCKDPNFRIGVKNKEGVIQPFADYRFLGGLAAAVAGQLSNNPMVTRVGHDVASGLLNSFVATETCIKNMRDAGTLQAAGAPAQIAEGDEVPGSGNFAGGHMGGAHANYAYGW
tara:strand:- start:1428 stop:1847 length:420 start_codon:yes stop_codon:yes gene_type:complete